LGFRASLDESSLSFAYAAEWPVGSRMHSQNACCRSDARVRAKGGRGNLSGPVSSWSCKQANSMMDFEVVESCKLSNQALGLLQQAERKQSPESVSGHAHDDSEQDSEKKTSIIHPPQCRPPKVSDDAGSRLTTLGNPSHGASRSGGTRTRPHRRRLPIGTGGRPGNSRDWIRL